MALDCYHEKNILSIEAVIDYYREILPLRPRALFSKFLAEGYRDTSLSNIATEHYSHTFRAKMLLGMLITLLDDLADNPHYFNPKLLRILYNVGSKIRDLSTDTLSEHESEIVALTDFLIADIKTSLANLPNWNILQNIFLFDIWQIYLSNRFSELMTASPWVRNITEAKFYGPYNMGMVAAGMIDLMATPSLVLSELGKCREIFLLGQRLGRIGNLIATFARENDENDHTNEIAIYLEGASQQSFVHYRDTLKKEHDLGIKKIARQRKFITNFDTKIYSQGLIKLFELHRSMMGVI